MKNYKVSNKHKYILNYKIRNGRIIVYYSLGKSEKFPYTKEKEREILEKMKTDFLENYDFLYSTLINKAVDNTRGFLLSIITLLMSLILSNILAGINFLAVLNILVVGTLPSVIGIIKNIYSTFRNFSFQFDMEKNKMYLYVEESINESSKKDIEILYGVSKKALKASIEKRFKKAEEMGEDLHDVVWNMFEDSSEELLDINTINSFSYSDVCIVIDNLKEEEEQEEPKKLSFKKNKRK